ncbi:choline kinase 1 [Actinidia rufa]|uniref:Choline kinase 1 n=1 Tax=Actinidia rufa TaxID=165716 RepID=A0A7J0EHU2_9ERIC|nr:choline kinase 1 [Actinidia rufa]
MELKSTYPTEPLLHFLCSGEFFKDFNPMAVKANGFIIPEELMKILLSLASNWGDLMDPNTLKVVHLGGAMTNEVYRISWPIKTGNDSRSVLVRIYGKGVEIFFNKDEEIRTFEFISGHGQGPQLLGQFPDGRIEEFIHARTLSACDLRDSVISPLIAAKLREFHNLEMPGSKNRGPLGPIEDYEYATYNPVAYDIANHFCEMVANYHTDTPHVLTYTSYPGLEERRRFVHVYLSSGGNEPGHSEVEQLVEDAEKYTLANHLFWGLWGIISAYVNNIDFDYMEYARQRFQQYWLRRPEFLGTSRGFTEDDVNDSA